MNTQELKIFLIVVGIAEIIAGVVLIPLRDRVRKKIFAALPQDLAHRFMRRMIILAQLVGIACILVSSLLKGQGENSTRSWLLLQDLSTSSMIRAGS